MRMNKQIFSFLSATILTMSLTLQGMEPKGKARKVKDKVRKVRSRASSWVESVVAMVSGETETPDNPQIIQQELEQSSESPTTVTMIEQRQPQKPLLFSALPKDVQSGIVDDIMDLSTSENLDKALSTLNSLARTNRALNEYINRSDIFLKIVNGFQKFPMTQDAFIAKIVKPLARKFNFTDYQICSTLTMPQAKKQLDLQEKLRSFCTKAKGMSIETISVNILTLKNSGADLNFSYKEGETPLAIADFTENADLATVLKQLGAKSSA